MGEISYSKKDIMDKLPISLQVHFFKFYENEIPITDFENWIYTNKELENLLERNSYTDLISLNFNGRHLKYEMTKIINPFLDLGKFQEWKLRNTLTNLIERRDNFMKSLIEIYYLYCSGYYFLENLALGYSLSFSDEFWDYSDWEILASNQKDKIIDQVYTDVKRDTELIIKWLDEEKIVITGKIDEIGINDFIDKR